MKQIACLGILTLLLAAPACDDGVGGQGGSGAGTTGDGGQGGDPAPRCGDGNVDEGEECDGNVGALTCADVDPEHETGTPTCDDACKIDKTPCTHTPVLTDGTIGNAQDCPTGHSVWGPNPGKVVAAARLTPPSYPFVAKTVHYTLTNGIKQFTPLVFCGSSYAHQLHVYVTTEETPPPEPAFALYVPVPSIPAPGGDEPTEVTVPLPQEVTLQEGEHLVLGVELRSINEGGGSISALCLLACNTGTSDPENFWSDAEKPPFSYVHVTDESYIFTVDGTFID